MDINLSISPAPGITTDWLIVAVYESTAPTTLVASQGFAAPHTSPQNIVFTGLNPVPHQVFVYQNATNAATGTVRHNFTYDPSYRSANIRADLFLIVGNSGNDPVTNASAFTRADLDGWNYSIERR